jgi:hypothetical protein
MAFGQGGAFGSDMFVANSYDFPGALVSLDGAGVISKIWLSTAYDVQEVQFGSGGSAR